MRARLRRHATWLYACLVAAAGGIWLSEHGTPGGIYGLTLPAMMVMLFLMLPKAALPVDVSDDDNGDDGDGMPMHKQRHHGHEVD